MVLWGDTNSDIRICERLFRVVMSRRLKERISLVFMGSNEKSVLSYANILENFKMYLELYFQEEYTLT